MMGTRKASEVKELFQQALARDSRAVQAWLDEEVAKLPAKTPSNSKVLEELVWVRNAL